jgi:DNA-binding protein H-NS
MLSLAMLMTSRQHNVGGDGRISRRSQEEARQRQEEAQQRQALLEQQLSQQQQVTQQMAQQLTQQQQMMNWFMNQAILASPPGSFPTPPFAFSWVSG